MDIVYKRVCGIDVHKKQITACITVEGKKEIIVFGTTTDALIQFCELLKKKGVEISAMESTASYWKPIYNLMEVMDLNVILANAQHIKNVPGRKSDVIDAEWIADLLRHGLLKKSFVPNRDQRELREITRYRASVVEERARELNRMEKVLQGANIKLSSAASSIGTASGLDMIRSIANGVTDPAFLASLARGTMKSKTEELESALKGLVQDHQRKILRLMLNNIAFLDKQIEELDSDINARLSADSDIVDRLDDIPGIGRRSAEVILSEIGTDMGQFPSAECLSSWAGVCPGNNQSAGKNKSGKTRKGNATLKKTLIQCAKSAGRSKNTYLSSMYKRIAARRGANRAAVAVGHAILKICYYMIRDNSTYNDLGGDYFNKRNEDQIVKANKRRLESLGYTVMLQKEGTDIAA